MPPPPPLAGVEVAVLVGGVAEGTEGGALVVNIPVLLSSGSGGFTSASDILLHKTVVEIKTLINFRSCVFDRMDQKAHLWT